MRIALHYISRGRCGWADEAAKDYTKRLNRYGGFKEIQHKPDGAADKVTAQRKEATRILSKLGSRDRLIVLDERGKDVSSIEMSHIIDKAALDGVQQLAFSIGGAYGHHEMMRSASHQTLRLSALVLNHQVARVMLLEQLYRGWTILKNEPYHHA